MREHADKISRSMRVATVIVVLGTLVVWGESSPSDAASSGTARGTGVSAATARKPKPVPPSEVVLQMPRDMYLHEGAPTEWWWHIGTLKAGKRTFGFEINTASFAKDGFAFTQIMLTDVKNQRHYQRTTPYVPPGNFQQDTWAQSDPSLDWYARLGDAANQLGAVQVTNPGSGYTAPPQVTLSGDGSGGTATATLNSSGGVDTIVVTNPGSGYTQPPEVTISGDGTGATARAFPTFASMESPAADPTKNMRVKALLVDDPSLTQVAFDLTLSQEGRPFYVWGTGVNPEAKGTSLQDNNYYFSLTRMHTSGSITIDGRKVDVDGITWMDHEYGEFGTQANPVKWILQDMQLDNGYSVSSASVIEDQAPKVDVASKGWATLEDDAGKTYLVDTSVTPIGPTWKSPRTGTTYFTKFRVKIPDFNANVVVTTLMDDQEFPLATSSVYEGVATAQGTFQGARVTGNAWIEQALGGS
jgi:predicted secreted hydrolase